MSRKKPQPLRNLIVVSDLHCGCRFGLCPASVRLDGGGVYNASPAQLKVLEKWSLFWDEWVPRVTHGEPYGVVLNGDTLDGRHHGSTTQVSQNLADQHNIAMELLLPIRAKCAGRLWVIRGTEAHVGPAGENEEKLATELKAIPDDSGHRSHMELRVTIGNALCHLTHHVGTTGSQHYEATAVLKELVEAYVEAGRNDHQAPDIIVRSHRHRHIKIEVPTRKGCGIAETTPGWQLKTPYVYKLPGGRASVPQIGGILIRQGDEEAHTRKCVWTLPPPPVHYPKVII